MRFPLDRPVARSARLTLRSLAARLVPLTLVGWITVTTGGGFPH